MVVNIGLDILSEVERRNRKLQNEALRRKETIARNVRSETANLAELLKSSFESNIPLNPSFPEQSFAGSPQLIEKQKGEFEQTKSQSVQRNIIDLIAATQDPQALLSLATQKPAEAKTTKDVAGKVRFLTGPQRGKRAFPGVEKATPAPTLSKIDAGILEKIKNEQSLTKGEQRVFDLRLRDNSVKGKDFQKRAQDLKERRLTLEERALDRKIGGKETKLEKARRLNLEARTRKILREIGATKITVKNVIDFIANDFSLVDELSQAKTQREKDIVIRKAVNSVKGIGQGISGNTLSPKGQKFLDKLRTK